MNQAFLFLKFPWREIGKIEALKQFEQANNLTVDGIYTNSDRQKLEAAVIMYANSENNDYQYKKLMELIK